MTKNSGNGSNNTSWRTWFKKMEDELLLSPKIIYFAISATFYAVYMFRAQFIKNYLNLNSPQYGDISAVMALVSALFMTVWGSFADLLGRHRLVLAMLCIFLACSFELCMFVADVDNPIIRFYLSAGVLGLYSFFACGLHPLSDFLALRILSTKPGFSKDLYGKQRVWGTISYGLITIIVGIVTRKWGPVSLFYITPLCSGICVAVLFALAPPDDPKPLNKIFSRNKRRSSHQSNDDKPSLSAHQEGTDGKLLSSSPLSNKEHYDDGHKEFPLAIRENVQSNDNLLLREKGNSEMTNDFEKSTIQDKDISINVNVDASPSIKKKNPVLQLLRNPNYLFMLFAVFMTGSARAMMTTFLAKYLSDQGLDEVQVAVAANFGIALEIVILFLGPNCLLKFGTFWMLIFAQIAMAVRCWAYFFIPMNKSTIWLFYGVELLKGVSFGFTQLSGVKLASDAAPKGLEATAQAIYTSVYSQLPAVIMAFVGGRVYASKGPQALFLITAVMITMALILFTAKYLLDGSIKFSCQGKRSERPLSINHQQQQQQSFTTTAMNCKAKSETNV